MCSRSAPTPPSRASLALCAEEAPDRPNTWINSPILNLYSALHRLGHAHSVECWRDGELVGGLYGVSLQGAFFGESMFSRATDASKVALAHLVALLKKKRLRPARHAVRRPTTCSISAWLKWAREAFQERLQAALEVDAQFGVAGAAGGGFTGAEVLQLITQTS